MKGRGCLIADIDDGRVGVHCPRCGAPAGQPCETVRAGGILLANHHPERGLSQLELLAGGYLKYVLVDDRGRPMVLWRRPTQRAIAREDYR